MNMRKIVEIAKNLCRKQSNYVYQIKFIDNSTDGCTATALIDLDQWNSKTYEFMSFEALRPGDMVVCLVKPGTTDATITFGKCVGSIPIECASFRTSENTTGLILCKFNASWFIDIMNQQNLEPLKMAIKQRKKDLSNNMHIRLFTSCNEEIRKMVETYSSMGGNIGNL